MIRCFFIFILILKLFCPDCSGQNNTINFRNGSWDEMVDQARKEKKQIFLDCYTDWCGPCKKLAQEIFTQDSVAEFYNRNFICVKMDMEKEGKELGKKYKVMAYPALLYIDSETEQVDHALVGFASGEKLLQEGRNAMDPLCRLGGFEKRYRLGERGMEFMEHYLGMLQSVARQKEQNKVLDEYARTLTDEQFVSAGFWKILTSQMNAQTSPFAYVYQRFMSLYRQFYKIAGEKEVNFRLNVVCQNYMSRYVRWNPSRGIAFDTVGYRALMDYLQQVEYPQAGIWMAQLTTADYMRKQDYRGMFKSIRETEKSQIMELSDEMYYLMLYLPCFLKCQEKALLNEVVHWIDGWLKKNPEGDIIKNIKTRLKEIALGNEGCVLNEYQYQKGKTNYSTIVPLFSLWAGQLSITCELRG